MRQEPPSGKSMESVINNPATERPAYRPLGVMVLAAEELLLSKMLRAIGDPPIQIVLWNGHEINRSEAVAASVLIRDRGALFKLISDPELHFGELYSSQRIEVQGSLLDFLEAVYRVWPLMSEKRAGRKQFLSFSAARANTLEGARFNIRHHYDLGNDFYKLWLDERMVYTCAYFKKRDMSLEEAQLAKLDHVCKKLRLKAGETVLEAGCGWGALALHMAKNYGVIVKAYNISKEQIAFARQRARNEDPEGRVEFIEDDYRNASGEFDAFVSIGMLEHVGVEHYRELGKMINRILKSNGRGLIHTIGLNYPRPMDAWASRHIFPGASPPSLAQMMQIFEPFDFSVLDVENLRLHYAMTLGHWLDRFERHADLVEQMFDQEFVRMWRLYLAGSLTAFKTGGMQLFQVAFARADYDAPLTRENLYESWDAQDGQL